MIGLDREDYIIERANARYDTGGVSGYVVASDKEDKKAINKVHYSYIDNKLFDKE